MRWAAATLVMAAACAAAPALADGYTPEWCAADRGQNDSTRIACADAAWCKAHWNDDRISRLACDSFRSKADTSLPALPLSVAGLTAMRPLNEAELYSFCFDGGEAGSDVMCRVLRHSTVSGALLAAAPGLAPDGMRDVRLALRLHITTGPFPVQVVKIGIRSPWDAVMTADFGYRDGLRRTATVHLNPGEITRLIAALNASHFWQLPAQTGHLGALDGTVAGVEVSIPGHRHHVVDSIETRPGGVDLTVLVLAIRAIALSHGTSI